MKQSWPRRRGSRQRSIQNLGSTPGDSAIIRWFATYQARMMLYLHYEPERTMCNWSLFRAKSNNYNSPLHDETAPLIPDLIQINSQGFVTISSQPGTSDQNMQHNYVDGFVLLPNLKHIIKGLSATQLWYRAFYLSQRRDSLITPELVQATGSSEFIFEVITHDAQSSSGSVFDRTVKLTQHSGNNDLSVMRRPTKDMSDILSIYTRQMGVGSTYTEGWMDPRLLPYLAYVEVSDQNSHGNTVLPILQQCLPTNSKSTILAKMYARNMCIQNNNNNNNNNNE